jgi:hypothetical protein
LAFEESFWGVVERLAQDESNPGVMRGRVVLLGLPLVMGEAQQPVLVGIVGLKALRKRTPLASTCVSTLLM